MDSLPSRCQVAIVGGGVAGLATAWALAEAGVGDVVVLEREAEIASHASGRNAAMCRALAEDDAWTALTARGAAWLAAPPEGFADRPLVDGRGAILLTRAPAPLAERAARHGLQAEPIDADAIAARWPGVTVDRGGLWFPGDGCIDLGAVIGGFAGGARRLGVRIVTGAEVTAIDGRARLATARGVVQAEIVVAAAGPWASALAARAGIEAAFVARKRHVFALTAEGGDAPILWNVDDDEWYARPAAGELWACACDHTASEPGDVAIDPAIEGVLRARLPAALAALPIARTWACQRTFVDGEPPRIGWDAQVPWWCWVAGLGGHGITASPEIGRRAAAAILQRY
jgi:D-arginine dehydrogenase